MPLPSPVAVASGRRRGKNPLPCPARATRPVGNTVSAPVTQANSNGTPRLAFGSAEIHISVITVCDTSVRNNMENEISDPLFVTTDRTLTRDRALWLIADQFTQVNAPLSACAPHSATAQGLRWRHSPRASATS
jgi:hypothetical protein